MIQLIKRVIRGALQAARESDSKRDSKREHPSSSSSFWDDLFGTKKTGAGENVTEDSAMNLIAVYACVRLIAETLGTLPLNVYRRLEPRGKDLARDHHLWKVLHYQANPWTSAVSFRIALLACAVLRGNAYAQVIRDARGYVTELWLLEPDTVRPMVTSRGRLVYEVTLKDGTTELVSSEMILHIRGFTGDGLVGYSPIQQAREGVGLLRAAEGYGSRFFWNGSRPGGVLSHPKLLDDDAVKRLRKSWEDIHSGLDNSHRVAILEEGVQWTKVEIDPKDSQFLETRRFQLEEIARLFRVPQHMIGNLVNASYNTVEQQSIDFLVHCIRPWAVIVEAQINHQLLTEDEAEEYFVEHKLEGMLRGSFTERMNGYKTGREMGLWSIDEIREMENWNPLPDGKGTDYIMPLNYQAIPAGGLAAADAAKANAPKPPDDAPESKPKSASDNVSTEDPAKEASPDDTSDPAE